MHRHHAHRGRGFREVRVKRRQVTEVVVGHLMVTRAPYTLVCLSPFSRPANLWCRQLLHINARSLIRKPIHQEAQVGQMGIRYRDIGGQKQTSSCVGEGWLHGQHVD
eukprot:45410-Eustigmatos_ZCMA.PRE.1